jgi:hypothetical protein
VTGATEGDAAGGGLGEEATGRLAARRAIEALRSGVPSREAVRLLGSAQPGVEAPFWQRLEAAGEDLAAGRQTPGLVIAGDFGAGKSHLLEYLRHLALRQGFACSKVVISKETPLYDPARLFRAALQGLVVPGKRGADLAEVAAGLDASRPAYAAFVEWVNDPGSGLNSRFPATLFLYERVKDPEILDRIASYWSGDPLNVGELRRWLRAHGAASAYQLERTPAKDLPFQRFAFAARLMAAAGFGGWVLFVDEVELIGRYSFMPRARSYAALARWAGRLAGATCPGLLAVFAVTSDFAPAILDDRNDAEMVPGKLRASGVEAELRLADEAEVGMRLIAREALPLAAPDRETVQHARDEARRLHGRAYDWHPPALAGGDDLSLRMRQHVRLWINEWDLRRADPAYTPRPVIAELGVDYSERPDLEAPADDGTAPGDDGPAPREE